MKESTKLVIYTSLCVCVCSSRVYQMSKLYLFSPSSGLYTCPLAMTDGAAKVIQVCWKTNHHLYVLKQATNRGTFRSTCAFAPVLRAAHSWLHHSRCMSVPIETKLNREDLNTNKCFVHVNIVSDCLTVCVKSVGASWPVEEAFSRLTTRQPEQFWTSGQWMTERQGGSDVGQ